MSRKRIILNTALVVVLGLVVYNAYHVLRIRAVEAARTRAVVTCATDCRMDQNTVETLLLATDGSDDGNESVGALIDEHLKSDEQRRACRPCVDAILKGAVAGTSVR